jgi:hypothetical protein
LEEQSGVLTLGPPEPEQLVERLVRLCPLIEFEVESILLEQPGGIPGVEEEHGPKRVEDFWGSAQGPVRVGSALPGRQVVRVLLEKFVDQRYDFVELAVQLERFGQAESPFPALRVELETFPVRRDSILIGAVYAEGLGDLEMDVRVAMCPLSGTT